MRNMTRRIIKIHQQHINFDVESSTRHLIVVETENHLPTYSYVVELPKNFIYYDEKYPFYTINEN